MAYSPEDIRAAQKKRLLCSISVLAAGLITGVTIPTVYFILRLRTGIDMLTLSEDLPIWIFIPLFTVSPLGVILFAVLFIRMGPRCSECGYAVYSGEIPDLLTSGECPECRNVIVIPKQDA